jgi:GH25 family lysozyme M1 (1,4-beta-N-acetylmuramidase)
VRASLVSLVLAISLVVPAAVSAADPPIEGIDISHWQGDIDWSQVAGANKAFAFMKASEDHDYTDPTYGLNRARAKAAGLHIGAYHFAQPSAAAGDAIAEADHFLETANIAAGDLPPVLDLERSNGLSDAAMQTWVRSYLERIYERTGVRGIIYTSPNFWSTYVGGTDWFATNGYRILWLAHWTTGTPTVPASDWAGFGWTFWQYTSSGTVAGIAGRVDLDRFAGTDVTAVLISPSEGVAAIPKPPFTDIAGSKFAGDIAWLYAEGITSGCSKTKYCPSNAVTRGQMAAFIARALDLPKTSKDYFDDDDGTSHEADINRLAKAGLTGGCGTRRYCPSGTVSRAQMATFLARVLDLSKTSKDYFDDDERSSHEANINKIARAGLTSGCAKNRYCPSGVVSRGQMAAFLHRTFGY